MFIGSSDLNFDRFSIPNFSGIRFGPFWGHALTFAWPHFWCFLHTLFCCTRLPTRLLCHHLVPTAAQGRRSCMGAEAKSLASGLGRWLSLPLSVAKCMCKFETSTLLLTCTRGRCCRAGRAILHVSLFVGPVLHIVEAILTKDLPQVAILAGS